MPPYWQKTPPLLLDNDDFVWCWDKREGSLPQLAIASVMKHPDFPDEYWVHDYRIRDEHMHHYLFYSQRLITPTPPSPYDLVL